jgi:hypothetical protein
MNQQVFLFALAAIGRLEALMQNCEAQYNETLRQLQEVSAERDALKAELEKKEKK